MSKVITEAKEKCEEVRQWIEEQIAKPVERWISEQEEHCRKLPWWNPLRWLCEVVTIVVKVVVWVVVTVGKWVVTIVCQVIIAVIGIIVTFVLRLISWVITFFVCLFTDPLEALKSFLDLWGIVLDTVGDILDFAGVLLEDVLGYLDDLENLIDSLISSLGWLGVLLGWTKGLIQLARDLVSIAHDALGALKDIVLGILGLNLCRLLRGLADLVAAAGRGLLNTGFAPVALLFGAPWVATVLLLIRVLGYLGAGERDTVNRIRLEEIIRDTLNMAFGEDGARIERVLTAMGINGSPMGLPFTSDARRLYLTSDDRKLDLRQLHKEGIINLYAYAGYPSDCGRLFNEAEGEVVYAGTDIHVSFTDLQTYLSDGPGSVAEFHVFSITRAKFRKHLQTARRKAGTLGVLLSFPSLGTIQATSRDHVPLNTGEDDPPGDTIQQQLFQFMGRTGDSDDLSIIPTISHFHYVPNSANKELFGLTSWFRPSQRDARRSGVTYRNLSPDWVFQWVLV
ncbi:hypothetical protein, partial [Acrocarpospora pleiomorpha]|uniref:hypothetical protein n=1 Tax=Acrocarpospora pleiomorpha TaxID=90975 RepID=UPI0012D36DE5